MPRGKKLAAPVIEEEPEEKEYQPLSLLDLLDAYMAISDVNGSTGKPVGMGEIYTYLSEDGKRYFDPGDFSDALTALIDSNPENATRGYRCNIEMTDDEYRSLTFTPIAPVKIDLEPAAKPMPPDRRPPAQEAPKPTEPPTYSQALEALRREYDASLKEIRLADEHFHRLEEKRLADKIRWEIGQQVYLLEKALSMALSENKPADALAVVESMKKLREELGYANH